MSIGPWQIIAVLVVIVLLFGRGKISDLMGDVAKGIKSFKKGIKEEDETEQEKIKTINHNELQKETEKKHAENTQNSNGDSANK